MQKSDYTGTPTEVLYQMAAYSKSRVTHLKRTAEDYAQKIVRLGASISYQEQELEELTEAIKGRHEVAEEEEDA